jgi:hypothetical protein
MQLNTTITPLAPHLLDLIEALQPEIQLTLVGGFGLILRQEYIQELNQPTLIERRPKARVTPDFDVLLPVEIYADSNTVKYLAQALESLQYVVLEKKEYFHKETPDGRQIKVDLLMREPTEHDTYAKVEGFRVKQKQTPKNNQETGESSEKTKIHGYRTREAFAIADSLIEIPIEGHNSSNQVVAGTVCIPHSYTFLLLKLFAFRDWETKKEGDNQLPTARKHAQDLYLLVASLIANEDPILQNLSQKYREHPIAIEAAVIVQELFAASTSIGVTRVQEGWERLTDDEIALFLETLKWTFPNES